MRDGIGLEKADVSGIPEPRDFGIPGAEVGSLDHHRRMVREADAYLAAWLNAMADRQVHPASALMGLLVTTRHMMKVLGGPTGDEMIRAMLADPDIPPELQRRYHEAVDCGVARLAQGGGRPS